MPHRLINFVLAILMLMPAGICTCDGGVVSCSDQSIQNLTHTEAGLSGGLSEAAKAGCASQAHRCPAPSPHRPSCRVVAPEFLTDAATSDISTSLPDLEFSVLIEWPTPLASRFRDRAIFTPLPASPIYLAHCVLLI